MKNDEWKNNKRLQFNTYILFIGIKKQFEQLSRNLAVASEENSRASYKTI